MKRKLPAIIVASLFAAVSGSALANTANKENKVSDPSSPSNYQTPSAVNATPGTMSTPAASSDSAMKPGVHDKKKQTARNDQLCDESRYPSKSAMPKECFEKQGTGAAAANSTQGQSGK